MYGAVVSFYEQMTGNDVREDMRTSLGVGAEVRLCHMTSLSYTLTHSLTHSLAHSLTIHPPIHPLTHTLTHSPIHPLTHTLTHSLTHSLTLSLSLSLSLSPPPSSGGPPCDQVYLPSLSLALLLLVSSLPLLPLPSLCLPQHHPS